MQAIRHAWLAARVADRQVADEARPVSGRPARDLRSNCRAETPAPGAPRGVAGRAQPAGRRTPTPVLGADPHRGAVSRARPARRERPSATRLWTAPWGCPGAVRAGRCPRAAARALEPLRKPPRAWARRAGLRAPPSTPGDPCSRGGCTQTVRCKRSRAQGARRHAPGSARGGPRRRQPSSSVSGAGGRKRPRDRASGASPGR
mmetsp:Transcript_23114/g.72764  ORF Transcript_23114/g.72764 Transcript_23114/m.72764 type:complete len:203 (-) Transcript_23114:288-896(-)